jgi:hypothetical protein
MRRYIFQSCFTHKSLDCPLNSFTLNPFIPLTKEQFILSAIRTNSQVI